MCMTPQDHVSQAVAVAAKRVGSYSALAREVGCGTQSIKKLLEGELVRLDQEQYYHLFALAGFRIEEARNA